MRDLAEPLRNPDLQRRIGVTLAALLIYRAGCWVPLPGVDATAFMTIIAPGAPGGAIAQASIMALGIVPLLSALILLEAALVAIPPLRAWASKRGNRERVDGWAVWAALMLAAFQANGIAVAMEDVAGLVADPGLGFRAGVVISMVAATAVVVWLASLITRHGSGSGFWIFVAVPHVLSFTEVLLKQSSLWGPISSISIPLSIGFLAFTIAVLAALARATPPLAKADELVWAPVLGFAVAAWLLAVPILIPWLVLGHWPSTETLYALAGQGAVLLPILTIPAMVLLRRLSLGGRASVAAGVPLAIAFAVLAALGTHLSHTPAQSLIPGPATMLILACAGLAILDGLRAGGSPDAPTEDSQIRPTSPNLKGRMDSIPLRLLPRPQSLPGTPPSSSEDLCARPTSTS